MIKGIGDGRRWREQRAQSILGRRREVRESHAEVVGEISRDGRVAPRAGEERRSARIAPTHGEGACGLEQLQRLRHHDAARFDDHGREDRLVSHECGRVRGTHRRAARAAPCLEHDDTHVALRASGQRLAPRGTITISFDVERDRADSVEQRHLAEEGRSVDHCGIPRRDDGVQAFTRAVRHADDADVAAIGDECHSAGRVRDGDGITPQRCPRHDAHQAVAVGADHGHASGGRLQCLLQVRSPGLRESGGVDHGAAAVQCSRIVDVARHGVSRCRDDHGVDTPGLGERGHTGDARGDGSRRMHADHPTGKARARKVEQCRVGVGALAVGRADDGHAAWRQESAQVGHGTSLT